MTRTQYRKSWLRLQAKYERRAYKVFLTSLRNSANKVPWEQLSEGNYKMLLEFNINEVEVSRAFYNTYLEIGTAHGKRVGKAINKELKNFVADSFGEVFGNILRFYVRNVLGRKIVSVRDSMVKYLLAEIERGMSEGLTIREISAYMQKLVNSSRFYRWQALRIARTETTAAANYGATIAGESSGIPLQKEWISANDARTRRKPPSQYDHLEMDGVRVDQKEKFNVDGDLILFPGDPEGQGGNVINCRCPVALVPKRDANGRLVLV